MSNHTTDVLDLRSNGAKFDSYLSKSNGAGPLSAQSDLHSNGRYGLLHKTNEMKKLVSGLPENEPLTLISIALMQVFKYQCCMPLKLFGIEILYFINLK